MKLGKDEKIILDDGNLGFRKKLTLTNERLVTQKGKGVFRVTWGIEDDISLSDIEEAYADVESFSAMSTMRLRLKNNKISEFRFKLSDTQALGSAMSTDMGTDMAMRVKFLTDRWLQAINHAIIQ